MECPFCGYERTDVYNSRNTGSAKRIWRRRRCQNCHRAFTSYEAPSLSFITIIKRDGRRQPYKRHKLLISLYFTCQGLEDQLEDIEAITDIVESRLLELRQPNISSDQLAETVLSTLKHFHPGAYMRYMSFRDSLSSNAELKEIAKHID